MGVAGHSWEGTFCWWVFAYDWRDKGELSRNSGTVG